MNKKIKNFLFSIFVMIFIIYIIKYPKSSSEIVINGLKLCYLVIIPVIFPFLIFSKMLAHSSFFKFLGLILAKPAEFLFGISGLYANAFIIGSIAGFPMGAKTVRDIYMQDKSPDSQNQAERTLAFCNNCSISFVVSAAGLAVFNSVTIGFILFFIQIIAAVFTGIIIKFIFGGKSSLKKTSILNKINKQNKTAAADTTGILDISEIISESVTGILNICGIVLFFFILINISMNYLEMLNLFNLDFISYVKIAVSGFFEVSSGIYSIAAASASNLNASVNVNFADNIFYKLILSSVILGWSGISVHFQIIYILKNIDLSLKPYFTGKIIHVIISVVITIITFNLPQINNLTQTYSALYSYQYYQYYQPNYPPAFYGADSYNYNNYDYYSYYMNSLIVTGIVFAIVLMSVLIAMFIFYLHEKIRKQRKIEKNKETGKVRKLDN